MTLPEKIALYSILALFFLCFALPVSLVGTADIRMVDAFNVDESEFLQLIKNEIAEHGLNMRLYVYGHTYFNTGLLPLMLIDFFHPVSEQFIIIFYRLLSALFFMGTLLIVFHMGRRFFGKATAWFSLILMLATSPLFYVYATMFHPDTAQLFFIALGIYYCCNYYSVEPEKKWKQLLYASIAAGLAFGSKYAGILLLPLLAVIVLMEKNELKKISRIHRWYALLLTLAAAVITDEKILSAYVPVTAKTAPFYLMVMVVRIIASMLCVSYLLKLVVAGKNITTFDKIIEKSVLLVFLGAAFMFSFALSSPGCIRGLNFIHGFIAVTDFAHAGHWLEADLGWTGWGRILISREAISYEIFFLATGLIIYYLMKGIKSRFQISPEVLILLIWVFIYFSTLAFYINEGFSHYLLPVIPVFILLAALAAERLSQSISKIFSVIPLQIIRPLLFIALFAFSSIKQLKDIYERRTYSLSKETTSDSIKTGNWLIENISPDSKILYERYAYIPVCFSNCNSSWGLTQNLLSEYLPDVIITNSTVHQLYLHPGNADKYLTGKGAFMEKNDFYRELFQEKLPYKLVKEFGNFRVYAKSHS